MLQGTGQGPGAGSTATAARRRSRRRRSGGAAARLSAPSPVRLSTPVCQLPAQAHSLVVKVPLRGRGQLQNSLHSLHGVPPAAGEGRRKGRGCLDGWAALIWAGLSDSNRQHSRPGPHAPQRLCAQQQSIHAVEHRVGHVGGFCRGWEAGAGAGRLGLVGWSAERFAPMGTRTSDARQQAAQPVGVQLCSSTPLPPRTCARGARRSHHRIHDASDVAGLAQLVAAADDALLQQRHDLYRRTKGKCCWCAMEVATCEPPHYSLPGPAPPCQHPSVPNRITSGSKSRPRLPREMMMPSATWQAAEEESRRGMRRGEESA